MYIGLPMLICIFYVFQRTSKKRSAFIERSGDGSECVEHHGGDEPPAHGGNGYRSA